MKKEIISILPASKEEAAKKYHSKSAIKNFLLQNYLHDLLELVRISGASNAFEVGCGEGQIVAMLTEMGG